MSTPIVDAGGSRLPAEMQYLNTTQKVDGFFMLTQSQPIYLMAVLSILEGPKTRPNPPPPPRPAYLDPDKFAPSETYKEVLEDEDELIGQRTGVGKKHLPRKDKAFEQRIRGIQAQIRKLKQTKQHLKCKHKEKYPDAIYSNDEAEYFSPILPSKWRQNSADFIIWCAQAIEDATDIIFNALNVGDLR